MAKLLMSSLRNCRVLVVEDEYLIADDVERALIAEGAEVLGPVPSLPQAKALLASGVPIDGALLDVNLGGEMVWPVVDALLSRSVPVVLATGYTAEAIPLPYVHLPRCEKPIAMRDLTRALQGEIRQPFC